MFKKLLTYFVCDNIAERAFFPIIKLVSPGKREFYLFYYNAIFKDSMLFKQTQSSTEIDFMVVKKTCLFKFR